MVWGLAGEGWGSETSTCSSMPTNLIGIRMTQRPYLMLGVQELEGLAQSSASNSKVVEDLIQELGHRRIPRAQRLKSRLERQRQQTTSKGGATSDSDGMTPVSEADAVPNPPSPAREAGSGSDDDYTDLRHRYEFLRTTFTVEAELLARWGMTPQLPHDLQELVFQEWNKRLANVSHGCISAEALTADRIRIAQERAFLEQSLKANGFQGVLPEIQTTFYGENHD